MEQNSQFLQLIEEGKGSDKSEGNIEEGPISDRSDLNQFNRFSREENSCPLQMIEEGKRSDKSEDNIEEGSSSDSSQNHSSRRAPSDVYERKDDSDATITNSSKCNLSPTTTDTSQETSSDSSIGHNADTNESSNSETHVEQVGVLEDKVEMEGNPTLEKAYFKFMNDSNFIRKALQK